MQILSKNMDARLDYLERIEEIPLRKMRNHVRVWHWDSKEEVLKFLDDWEPRSQCRGLLLLRGLALAGFTSAEVERCEENNRHRGRLHFLRYAFDCNSNASVKARLRSFFAAVGKLGVDDRIPWELLHPPSVLNLTQVYLVMALIADDDGCRNDLCGSLSSETWVKAADEFIQRGGRATDWPGLEPHNSVEARKYSSHIKSLLIL